MIANTIGTSYTNVYTGTAHSLPEYCDAFEPCPDPDPSDAVPLDPIPITQTNHRLTPCTIDNLRNPYVQNLTLALVRNIGSNLTVDVRYVGTLTRKSTGPVDINSANFLHNGLLDAFSAARRGGDSPLLDQIFNGINYAGIQAYGPVGTICNGVLQTGACTFVQSGNTNANLPTGTLLHWPGLLATANYVTTNPGNEGLPFVP